MSSPSTSTLVIVGGGLAGARTCAELRKQGFEGTLVLLGEEQSLPYDRPPLSKAVLAGKRESKPLRVKYDELAVDVRLGWLAESLDLGSRTVVTDRGPVPFDRLVIATGSHALHLPGHGPQCVLRTDQDALALRDRLQPGAHVLVVGASWIGAEVSATALSLGCRVTCLEFGDAPLAQALGGTVGSRFTSWWDGIDLRTGTSAKIVDETGVVLSDGTHLAADVVVSGIGVRASTGWLADSGLELLPAVPVDEQLRTGTEGVYALGDAAAWWSRRYDRRLSVQHWDDASSAPAVVAASVVLGAESTVVHDPVPYFWSDQFGHRIEYVGHHDPTDEVVFRDLEEGWSASWLDSRGRLTAALGVDASKQVIAGRQLIADAATPTAAELAASSLTELAGT